MEDPTLKRQALFLLALSTCRGLLYSVRAGAVDVEEIDRILHVTSLAHMAEVLGVDEVELALDCDEQLSREERALMRG